MNNDCKQCMYFDNCSSYEVCADYTPLEDDVDIDKIIESRRTEFREEWFQYIEENEEYFLF
ncbi:MAG: hypothetical protein K2F81_04560 [Ruminococcus sp.]|nr:hypothetical protein [Ruminococcus sp.]